MTCQSGNRLKKLTVKALQQKEDKLAQILQSTLFFSTIIPLLNPSKTCNQTPTSPTTITTQWSIQRPHYMTAYTVTHPATCQAPCPYPMEHPLMRVLLNGDVPRATPSREPTGRTQQSHGGHAALRAQASHSLWAWYPQRPHAYLDTPRVTHWTMASIPQP